VGHSLGGLVIRQAVQQAGLEEAASVVTVATPHGGVDLAHFSRLTAPTNTIARQLRPGSGFLRALWASSQPRPETRFVAYYSNLDLLVTGRRAMMLEPELAASNVLVKDHGHLSVVLSRRLSASVAEEIAVAEVRARRLTHTARRPRPRALSPAHADPRTPCAQPGGSPPVVHGKFTWLYPFLSTGRSL